MVKKYTAKLLNNFYSLAGSWLVVAGWNWYHLARRPHWRFVAISAVMWLFVFVGWQVFKKAFDYLTERWHRHEFWHKDFSGFLDALFFIVSLWFLVFFSKSELFSLLFTVGVLSLLFWRLHYYLSHHPEPRYWLTVNRRFFVLALFLFIIQAGLQYTAYHYYILDGSVKFFNIVLFRAIAMTLVWLFMFVLASFSYWLINNKWLRLVPVFLWAVLFVAFISFWLVNIGVLYYSGLHIGPAALEHARGSSEVFRNNLTWYLVSGGILVVGIFLFIIRKTLHSHRAVPRRYWHWYQSVTLALALVGLAGLSSLKNTPEHAVMASFYDYYRGNQEATTLNPTVLTKLERFGLFYQPEEFYVNRRSTVFSPTSSAKLLPKRLQKNRPNILIVFLESFSARLTGVYNENFKDVTPGLNAMASDPNTTVFKNYYNASTPTITGELSQLCSFLPPTGHEEIQNQGKIKSLRLLCLPEALKQEAGFKYAASVTAVDKTFANKEGIFGSMAVDDVIGTEELAAYIREKPLSWGYSDHQMFPAVWGMMQNLEKDKRGPWLMMMTTIDTHPPFNLSKDAVNYQDGSRVVLNAVHSTDDAFKKFWDDFKQSPLYNNTIVVAIADHAIFPAALAKDIFPGGKEWFTFYDANTFLMYVPDSILPKEVATYSSGLDVTPTLLHILDINIPNSFEGHSIFDDRKQYPNLLGMHELGLYINQIDSLGKRRVDYELPSRISCVERPDSEDTDLFTLCDYLNFYKWKRQMFEQGRFWK